MLTTILTGVLALTAVIVLLVAVLMFCEKIIVKKGKVKLLINDDPSKSPEVDVGSNLLMALSAQKIFLPSACGGKGSCAMCKCQVFEGGGDILPSELTHIKRAEAKDGWRLSCQVKVRGPMKIKVPDAVFGIRKWECTVTSNDNVATFIKELKVSLPPGEVIHFESGGYIQIDVPAYQNLKFKDFDVAEKYRGDWDKFKLWDLKMKNPEPLFRAYSMANHPAEGNIVMLNIRIATPPWDRAKGGWMDVNPGVCSSYIFNLKPGDKVMVSGPYGEFHIKETDAEMIYIGGGAGMAPMRSHLFHLFHTLKTGRKVSYWYGGRSRRELFYIDDFRQIEAQFPNFKFHLVLSEPLPDDNWTAKTSMESDGDGFVGFVHQALIDNYLSKHDAPEDIEFYFCGPPMMNAAVLIMVDDFGVPPENVSFDDFGG